ncbi:MAG: hypothetical protein LBD35_00300 [Prevotellaceae bacterium]|nr:hypothetical protein [Prevotellaceae bacterium]
MITIKRSEYEQLLSRIEELNKLVQQLREEMELLKNGRGGKTGSTPPSRDKSRRGSRRLHEGDAGKSDGSDHALSASETEDPEKLRELIQKLLEEIELLKNGRSSETVRLLRRRI